MTRALQARAVPGDANIPPDFSVDLTYTTKPIDLDKFYERTLLALLYEATQDFHANSLGYFGQEEEDFSIVIIPSRPQVPSGPSLQNSHIVWALQKVAETLRLDDRFTEVDGLIKASRSLPNEEDTGHMGNYFARAIEVSKHIAKQNLPARQCPAISAKKTYHFPDDLPPSVRANLLANSTSAANALLPFRFDVSQPRFGRTLDRVPVFLTAIRAVARVAEIPAEDPLRIYTWADAELGLACHTYGYPDRRNPIAQQVATGFVWLTRFMLETGCFSETIGTLYVENEEGEDEELAIMEVKVYNPLEAEHGSEGVEIS